MKQSILLYPIIFILAVGFIYLLNRNSAVKITDNVSSTEASIQYSSENTSSDSIVDLNTKPQFSISELEEHNTKEDCYVGVNGTIYNISKLITSDETLVNICGTQIQQSNLKESILNVIKSDNVIGSIFYGK